MRKINNINLLLSKRNRKEESLAKQKFLKDFEFTYISKHNIDNSILELKHIILEFISD